MDTTEKVIALAALGVGGYFVYTNFFANALPADAEYMGQVPIGTGIAVPQSWAASKGLKPGSAASGPATTQLAYLYYGPAESLIYVSYTAPTSATPVYSAPAATSPAASSTPGSTNGTTLATSPAAPASTGTPTTPAPVASIPATSGQTYPLPGGGTAAVPTTLAGLWAAMQAWFANDTNFSGSPLSATLDHINFYLTYIWPTPPESYSGTWPPNLAEVFPGVDGSTVMSTTQYWAAMLPYLQGMGLSGYGGLGCCDCGGGGLLLGMLTGAALLLTVAIWGGIGNETLASSSRGA